MRIGILTVKKKGLLDIIAEKVVLGDGAMGTMLYSRGVFLNTCFEQLNLDRPDLVREIHEAYVDCGVDFIETNSFGANEYRLGKYGLAGEVESINRAAVEIASQAAGDNVLVAGAIGPLGIELTEYSPVTREKVINAFRAQARILVRAGVDFLLLETFSNTDEILTAIQACLQVTDVPIVAQMTATEHQETIYGERIEQAIERFAGIDGVVAVGLNCSTGPSAMLESLERIRSITDKPVSVQPNAGLPRRVEDRTLYMSTPEYMAEYAKRFFEKGARIIGGCCGTSPEHIKAVVRVIRSLDGTHIPRKSSSVIDSGVPAADQREGMTMPLADKSRLGSKLATGQRITTVEITPPRGVSLADTIEKARLCAEMGVDAVNVPDGPRASSRMSPLVTAIEIQRQAGIETILHFCCRDRNLIGMQSDILGAAAMGLHNLLIITGDPPKLGDYPDATAVFDMDSIALTAVVRELNGGRDIGGNAFTPGVCMTMGVGANPVAADLPREIARFKRKVAAGAEYAITQPVFDPDSFFRFLEAIQSCRIPIIAGIWPFTSYKNAEFMANEVPGVSVPPALLQRMSTARTKEQGRRLGIQIARDMMEHIKDHVGGFAVSAPFGNVRTALAVLGKVDMDLL